LVQQELPEVLTQTNPVFHDLLVTRLMLLNPLHVNGLELLLREMRGSLLDLGLQVGEDVEQDVAQFDV